MTLTVYAVLGLALLAVVLLTLKLHGAALSWWWVFGAFLPFALLLAVLLYLAWTLNRVGH